MRGFILQPRAASKTPQSSAVYGVGDGMERCPAYLLIQILAVKKVFFWRVLHCRLQCCIHKLYFTIGIYMNNRNCVSKKSFSPLAELKENASAPKTILQVK